METFIKERRLLKKLGGLCMDHDGQLGDLTGHDANEGMTPPRWVAFRQRGLRPGCSSRTLAAIIGLEFGQLVFDVYGTKGARRWNLETIYELKASSSTTKGNRTAAGLHHRARRRP